MAETTIPTKNRVQPLPGLKKNWGPSLLWTIPMVIWALLVFSRGLFHGPLAERVAAITTTVFLAGVFFWMMKSGETYRPRRIFFVALGFLFPVGFISELIAQRGSMSISLEQMLLGNTPFCHLALPMMALPAILSKTIIFPGSILPKPENPHAFGTMLALWVGATLILGRGWCSWGCFFGGIEEGFASFRRKPLIQNVDQRWTLFPWAMLVLVIVGTAISLSPFYCEWICPFKTVTEFPAVTSLRTAVQFGIFTTLFVAIVVILPLLTKKRTQCSFFCPLGPIQALTNKINIFELKTDPDRCVSCGLCGKTCPFLAIDPGEGGLRQVNMYCSRCAACADVCRKGAVRFRIKGTPFAVPAAAPRMLFLFATWIFATMFGGSIVANSLGKILGHFI
jgi:Pyruvate/2-oxoacid:ferredoxin oxidoreductase delta subunit